MNNNDDNKPKGRGRPPILTPEEKEQRRIANNKKRNEIHKRSGYAAQKKYLENNEDEFYPIRVTIRQKYKETLYELVEKSGMASPSKLFIDAVEKVYGTTLQDVDKDEKI